MGNMIECMALNCDMKDKVNEDKNSSDSNIENKKNVEDKKQYLEMEDNLVQYSKHYEENSIENSIVLTEEGS
jgi:hypothetical protein